MDGWFVELFDGWMSVGGIDGRFLGYRAGGTNGWLACGIWMDC